MATKLDTSRFFVPKVDFISEYTPICISVNAFVFDAASCVFVVPKNLLALPPMGGKVSKPARLGLLLATYQYANNNPVMYNDPLDGILREMWNDFLDYVNRGIGRGSKSDGNYSMIYRQDGGGPMYILICLIIALMLGQVV